MQYSASNRFLDTTENETNKKICYYHNDAFPSNKNGHLLSEKWKQPELSKEPELSYMPATIFPSHWYRGVTSEEALQVQNKAAPICFSFRSCEQRVGSEHPHQAAAISRNSSLCSEPKERSQRALPDRPLCTQLLQCTVQLTVTQLSIKKGFIYSFIHFWHA